MSVENSDSDSNDSEVFVLKEIKPVLIKSSQLVQLTLEGTSVKGSVNFLNNTKNNDKNKRNKLNKRRSHSNDVKSKKLKRSTSGGGSPKKTSPIKSIVKNINNSQSTSKDEEIILDEVKKSCVKNVQKSIHSYFVKKEVDVDIKEAEKAKLDTSLNNVNERETYKKINFKSGELPNVEDDKVNDINESIITVEETKKCVIVVDEPENNSLEKECRVEKALEASDKNLEEHSSLVKTSTAKIDSNTDEFYSLEGFQDDFFNDGGTFSIKEKYIDHSELLCIHFKKIIKDELKKQVDLQNESLKNGKVVEKLILDYECEIMDKFLSLNENACKVFIRMLGRKRGWHRVCAINYPGISSNLNKEFDILNKEGFIDSNIEDENLKTQMELLNKSEVLELCKAFSISVKSSNSNSCKKETLISCFLSSIEKQKSALDMFKIKSSTSRPDILKSKVRSYLGSCVKINDKVFQAFYKILLLFSFAHYYDEESKRFSNEMFMWLQVIKNIIRFPNYKLSPTVVFETLADFEDYKNSLLLQDNFEVAVSNKNYDEFVSVYNQAKVEFKKLLENKEYQKRFLNLKPFLRKFSAGTIYAKILTRYCKTFKKQSSNSDIANTAQMLLDQNLFLTRKKGEWYEILSKVLENQKQNNAAAELIIKSLNDPTIDEVQKFTLQLRGQSILKKKTCGISETQLKDLLDSLCTSSIQEPTSVEIKGRALEGNSGFKSVYIQEVEHGKVYASVEERAILHYKSIGFTQGYHSEGFIIQTIYFLLFFDIIYGPSPEGVFQSPYQKAPLDLNSRSFFQNRNKEIELLMNEMLTWDDEQVEAKIKDSYYKNCNTVCVIAWNDKFTPELFYEIIKCITMPILVLIFDRLVKNFRIYRSGFPDLTLWNPETNKCKFVEVKSPNDKLSPAQRIWLDFLKNIGLDCEVCNVKTKALIEVINQIDNVLEKNQTMYKYLMESSTFL